MPPKEKQQICYWDALYPVESGTEEEGRLIEWNQCEPVLHAVSDSQSRCSRRLNHLRSIDMLITIDNMATAPFNLVNAYLCPLEFLCNQTHSKMILTVMAAWSMHHLEQREEGRSIEGEIVVALNQKS
ncbi:hypothetical protein YC2023_027537 [Brassica napus]